MLAYRKITSKYLVIFAGTACLLFFWVVDLNYNFTFIVLWSIAVFIGIPALVWLLAVYFYRKKKTKGIICSVVLSGMITGSIGGMKYNLYAKDITTERGDQVISAFKQYHREHQYYPSSLEKLLPTFLDQVPDTALGVFTSHQFKFENNGPDSYRFQFFEIGMFASRYSLQESKWEKIDLH